MVANVVERIYLFSILYNTIYTLCQIVLWANEDGAYGVTCDAYEFDSALTTCSVELFFMLVE